MKHREYTITPTGSSTALHLRVWEPESAPIGIICVLHGQGEHSGRYTHFAYFFSKKGYAVTAVDLPGHGLSEGKRGHVESYADYLQAADALIGESRRLFPNLPVVLYGHSMGGNIALSYAMAHRPDAVVASSPWIKLAQSPSALQVSLAKFVRRIMPYWSQSTQVNVHALSKDPKIARLYMADAMVHDRISIEAYLSLAEAGAQLLQHADRLQVPTLLMHGTADTLTAQEASQEFAYRSVKSTYYKPWEGALHELHNEREWKEILAFVYNWVGKKLKSQMSANVAA